MEFIEKDDIKAFANPGVTSHQLLNPDNSSSERITITRVVVAPGAEQPRHTHPTSEQIWIATAGEGTLLLADGAERAFRSGDVVRFADGDVHGLINRSGAAFEYLSVTSPPINFRAAYAK
ncbi:MAG TPA: cupin domain-containing protein [Treponemataceae bacterium]|nr:cupin domain-containing protein [Treponemataceae bacterium]HPS43844.1 cupin domain-containing protein [Treponemataceae bacterium]